MSDRITIALYHLNPNEIFIIEWRALRNEEKIYRVICVIKTGSQEICFKWLANLSSNRITPLDMTTQEIMGGGFY